MMIVNAYNYWLWDRLQKRSNAWLMVINDEWANSQENHQAISPNPWLQLPTFRTYINVRTPMVSPIITARDHAIRIFEAQIRILSEDFKQFDQVFWRCFASTYSQRHGWKGDSWEIHASTLMNGFFIFFYGGCFVDGLDWLQREED